MTSEIVQAGEMRFTEQPQMGQLTVHKTNEQTPTSAEHNPLLETQDDPPAARPPPILCLGAVRTGTLSMCTALRILGYGKVHHGTEVAIGDEHLPMWRALGRAADATFPNLPTYTGEPFTRADWDEVFGGYDAVSDIASFYAMSLIRAYPEAKVILVERDIESWLKSAKAVFENTSKPMYHRLVSTVEKRTKNVAGSVSNKYHIGWTQAKRPEDCLKNMRDSYIRHYKEIRQAVPKEQLLDYRLGNGWEPLCEFLGREVPDAKFPHLNDAVAYKKHVKRARDAELKGFAKAFLPK